MYNELAFKKKQYDARKMAGLCTCCSSKPEPGRTKCRPCLNAFNKRTKERAVRLKEAGLCPTCGKRKFGKRRLLCNVCHKQRLEKHLNGKDYDTKYTKLRRSKVLEAYGTVCKCCGEAEEQFLSIDHIDGGGNKHAKEVGSVYKWLIANGFPPGFQTLCINCNIGKFRNGGICPHKGKHHEK